MVNSGKPFEQLCYDLFIESTISEEKTEVLGPRCFLDGHDGKREFDIVLKTQIAGLTLLTVIECRDFKKKIDVTHLDGFISKMQDVNANKGVIISRKGFSKKALNKGRRLGLDLRLAHDIRTDVADIIALGFSVPIIVVEILNFQFGDIKCEIDASEGDINLHRDCFMKINDEHPSEHIMTALRNKNIPPEKSETFLDWISPPGEYWIRDTAGSKVPLKNFSTKYQIKEINYYFGYLQQLPHAKGMISLIEKSGFVSIKIEDFQEEFRTIFKKYNSLHELPAVPEQLRCVMVKRPNVKLHNLTIQQAKNF